MSGTSRPPRVSVVLPCYNAHEYLGRALRSVRAQTFSDLEIIVVDDGSTNADTIAFLDAPGADIRLIRQSNKGLPAARNAGFLQARGEFVLPLDCDDWIAPTFLAKALAALDSRPDRAFAYAHLSLEGNESGILAKRYNFFEQLFLNHIPYCILIRKSVWRQAGGYDETMRAGCEDWEFNMRLGSLGYFGVEVAEPLFHYRVSPTGMLQSLSSGLYARLWTAIQRKHPQLFRPVMLFRTWRQWRLAPRNHPLPLYFAFYLMFKLLPQSIFMAAYRRLLSMSRTNRAARSDPSG